MAQPSSVPLPQIFAERMTQFGMVINHGGSLELDCRDVPVLASDGISSSSKTKLMFRYCPAQISNETLTTIFGGYGELKEDAKVVENPLTHERKGYGFVEYVHEADARKAQAEVDGMQLLNNRLKVYFAKPQNQIERRGCLYVDNLPASWSIEDVYQYFHFMGPLVSIKLLLDESRCQTGKGFVRYAREDHARFVIQNINGYIMAPGNQPLIVQKATTGRGKRRQPASLVSALGNANIPSANIPSANIPSANIPAANIPAANIPAANIPAAVAPPQQEWSLFIGNIIAGVTKVELKALLQPAEFPFELHVTKIGTSGSPGFGFLNLSSSEVAFMCWTRLNGYEIRPGKFLRVSPKV